MFISIAKYAPLLVPMLVCSLAFHVAHEDERAIEKLLVDESHVASVCGFVLAGYIKHS